MISKTTYVNYCKCPSLYYLNEKYPEENIPSDYDTMLMEQGNIVGKLARNYFNNTILIEGNNEIDKANNTIKAIREGKQNIAEASFIFEDLFCAVDVLHKVDNGYEIYEVKSATSIDDYYIDDVSFQTYVLTKLGYNIVNSYVLYINNKYIYQDNLDLNKYFHKQKIEIKDDVSYNINKIRNLINKPERVCITPCKKCNYFKRCYEDISSPNIFELASYTKTAKRFNEGIVTFNDIIDNKIKINSKQLQQIEFELYNLPRYINKVALKEFLDTLIYPIYFLDFETNEDVIPFINGTHPRQKRVIQYSLHIKESIDSQIIHKEYLQDNIYDNLNEVADLLIADLKEKGSIIVYHKDFECGRIKELANILPDKSDKLLALIDRVIDLEIPFKNRYIYDKALKGKSSIKKVLPTLCKNFESSYANLPLVHNGTDAMTYFSKMMDEKGKIKEDIRFALLEYCKLDTLAMVEILDEIYKMIK